MPTDQPSSAPQGDSFHPKEELTAAAVLHDDQLDAPPGGGGLGGASAAASVGQSGAVTRNSPINAPTPHDAGDALAESEARRQAVDTAPPEQGHGSL